MKIDYNEIIYKLKGTKVPKPVSGTLSGHAAGEPCDKHVTTLLKNKYADKVFRQYEYLNYLFTKNPDNIGVEARNALFNSPTLVFLLSRGKNATDKWSIDSPFEEKQNDTADILAVDNGFYEIIDIKTRNISKTTQPPNIISAYKLAQTCAKIIDNKEYDTFDINYIEIDWELEGNELVCKDAHHRKLFKANPSDLYINWAAAMQIQFHVVNLDQSFTGSKEKWAREYLKHFVEQAKKRSKDLIEKFVKPFEKYIK
ncbi:MAG: HincII family type II restriction endonuclease [Bacteroidales bacterium]|nr:HincII family type II restriction endonuclease [Bacteroidales bacterium]